MGPLSLILAALLTGTARADDMAVCITISASAQTRVAACMAAAKDAVREFQAGQNPDQAKKDFEKAVTSLQNLSIDTLAMVKANEGKPRDPNDLTTDPRFLQQFKDLSTAIDGYVATVNKAASDAKMLPAAASTTGGSPVPTDNGNNPGLQKTPPAVEPNPPVQLGSDQTRVIGQVVSFVETPGGKTADRPAAEIETAARQLPPGSKAAAGVALSDQKTALDKTGSRDGALYEGIGARFNALGRPQDAIPSLDKAVQLNGKDADAFGQRARAKAMLGDRQGALDDASLALKFDPHNQLALIIRGHQSDLGASAGRLAKQKLDFGAQLIGDEGARGKGAATGPGGIAPQTAANPGDTERAIADLRPAKGFSPYIQKALEARRMKDKSSELLYLSQAIDSDPKDPLAWALRAELKIAFNNLPGAVSDAKHALDLHPSVAISARALRAKALAEIEQGDYASALADVAAAIQLEPENGLGFLYKAMAEEKLGRTAEALKDYDKADDLDLSLTPLTSEAFQRLGNLPGQDPAMKARAYWDRVKPRVLLQGGIRLFALGLIALGLLGAVAGRALTKRSRQADLPNTATILDGGAGALSPGAMLGGNYRVTGELGRGGMGVVYDALDETLQRRVAIKQLQRDAQTTSADLERFLREARLVAQLKHPNLAEIYTVVNSGDLYLVFEFVDGRPLDKVLSESALPAEKARRILSEVAGALAYAHERKIIHRDLKPSNIMIAQDGTAKIMDFGIAHQSQSGRNQTLTVASGTPPYMAPEQALGSVSKAADLYALAVMAYEMLTGCLPFSGPDFLEQKIHKNFVPPSQRNAALRRELDAFFARALDPDPTKRPADAKAFLREFEGACSALGRS